MTKIEDKSAAGIVTKTVEYPYDAFNRRTEKKIDADGNGLFEHAEQFVYDGDHIALRFVDPDGDGPLASSLANRYLHNPQFVDQVLADEQVTSLSSPGTVLWPLADNLGTVRDLVDNDGDVANHLVYDSFGNLEDETNAAVDHIFGYTGRETDEESDLQYYRNRYYDPANGRFISEDPLGFAAGDQNLNRYVGNAPTNYTDPFGLDDSSGGGDQSGGGDGTAPGTDIGDSGEPSDLPPSEFCPPDLASIPDYRVVDFYVDVAQRWQSGQMSAAERQWWQSRIDEDNAALAQQELDDAVRRRQTWSIGRKPSPMEEALAARTQHYGYLRRQGYGHFSASLGVWMNPALDGSGMTFNDHVGMGGTVAAAMHCSRRTTQGLGGNPFIGKTPELIDEMFRAKGYRTSGPDPALGKGGYINPKTGRSYHIDPSNRFGEEPHVDVNRLRGYRGPLEKKKYEL